jgi:hypothetical protein
VLWCRKQATLLYKTRTTKNITNALN